MSQSPPSLKDLLEEPQYSALKNMYIQRRAEFKTDPQASVDLEAYERGDADHQYTAL